MIQNIETEMAIYRRYETRLLYENFNIFSTTTVETKSFSSCSKTHVNAEITSNGTYCPKNRSVELKDENKEIISTN